MTPYLNLSGFALRSAAPADVPALHTLIERSVRGLQADDYTPQQMDGALGHTLGLDTQLIQDGTYFVVSPANEPDRIIGCGGWSFRRTTFGSDGGPDRIADVLDPLTDAARIRAIFIDPAFARQGLGSFILALCESSAELAGFSRFEMASTLTGLPLYKLKGYEEVSRVNVPLPNGEVLPIVRMRKAANKAR